MKRNSIPQRIGEFIFSMELLLKKPLSYTISDCIDAAIFPDEIYKLGGKKSGVYIISSKVDDCVIYVGISEDVPNRIYEHIGKGFSWSRNGNQASFPNCTLADGRSWLNPSTQDLLRKAEWNITVVLPEPHEISKLIESYLIFWGLMNECKPEINVGY